MASRARHTGPYGRVRQTSESRWRRRGGGGRPGDRESSDCNGGRRPRRVPPTRGRASRWQRVAGAAVRTTHRRRGEAGNRERGEWVARVMALGAIARDPGVVELHLGPGGMAGETGVAVVAVRRLADVESIGDRFLVGVA